MTVSFCGHSKLPPYSSERELVKKLYATVENLIKEGADTFVFHVSGYFNHLSALVVNMLSVNYPHIKTIVSVPYAGCDYNKDLYDTEIFLDGDNLSYLEDWHKNIEHIIEMSDTVVSYINHDLDAYSKGLLYANKLNKRVISLI